MFRIGIFLKMEAGRNIGNCLPVDMESYPSRLVGVCLCISHCDALASGPNQRRRSVFCAAAHCARHTPVCSRAAAAAVGGRRRFHRSAVRGNVYSLMTVNANARDRLTPRRNVTRSKTLQMHQCARGLC